MDPQSRPDRFSHSFGIAARRIEAGAQERHGGGGDAGGQHQEVTAQPDGPRMGGWGDKWYLVRQDFKLTTRVPVAPVPPAAADPVAVAPTVRGSPTSTIEWRFPKNHGCARKFLGLLLSVVLEDSGCGWLGVKACEKSCLDSDHVAVGGC